MPVFQTRRQFLTAVSLIGADGPLETTEVRLFKTAVICLAPQYLVDDLLRSEGFTDIRYIASPNINIPDAIAAGEYDFSLDFASDHIFGIDRGVAITLLAGVHVGCYELFAKNEIRSIPS